MLSPGLVRAQPRPWLAQALSCVESGDADKLQKLLSQRAEASPTVRSAKTGPCPPWRLTRATPPPAQRLTDLLYKSVETAHPEVVAMLLGAGASAHAPASFAVPTPLHAACASLARQAGNAALEAGLAEVLRLLVKAHPVALSTANSRGQTPAAVLFPLLHAATQHGATLLNQAMQPRPARSKARLLLLVACCVAALAVLYAWTLSSPAQQLATTTAAPARAPPPQRAARAPPPPPPTAAVRAPAPPAATPGVPDSGSPPWVRGKAKGEQEAWLRRLGMAKEAAELKDRARDVAAAEGAFAAAAKTAATAGALSSDAAGKAAKAQEAMSAASARDDFVAAARHKGASQEAFARAQKEASRAQVAQRAADEAAEALATRRATLGRKEALVAELEGLNAEKELALLTLRTFKLAHDLSGARGALDFASAEGHAAQLRLAKADKAELLRRYSTLVDPGAAWGARFDDDGDAGLLAAAVRHMEQLQALVELAGGAEGPKSLPASKQHRRWLSYLGMESEATALDSRRRDAAEAADRAAGQRKLALAAAKSAAAERRRADDAQAAMKAAVARGSPAEARKHQETQRSADALASTAQADAAAAEAAAADAHASAATRAEALSTFEASVAQQELFVADLQARTLAKTIAKSVAAYDAAMAAADFEQATPLQREIGERRKERAELVAAYMLKDWEGAGAAQALPNV